jgi:glutathione S-transferase
MAPDEVGRASHLEMNPFGRIPVLEHGDFRLYETQAILRYLDRLMPEPSWVPADPRAAARMDQIIGINDWYFFPKVGAKLVFQRLVGPALFGMTPDETVISAALPMARTCVTEFERLLGDGRFLAGGTFSIADIMLACQLDLFAATPEGAGLLKGTRLESWLARMAARPSMIATQLPEALRGAA